MNSILNSLMNSILNSLMNSILCSFDFKPYEFDFKQPFDSDFRVLDFDFNSDLGMFLIL